jgi:hypothetical protein
MRLLALIALAVTLAGCSDALSVDTGQMTGRLDGTSWNGSAAVSQGPADGPVIYSRVRTSSSERTIGIDIADSWREGTYAITPDKAWYVAAPLGGGDAYYAQSVSGTLVVESSTDSEMSGRVEITFRGPGGELVHFQNGEFRINVIRLD